MNERGWVEPKNLPREYRIRDDDEIAIVVWRYYHKQCNFEKQANEVYGAFYDVFVNAGFRDIFMKDVLNEYWPRPNDSWYTPWFAVDTEIGRIKIGWRKRVISIDWSDLHEHHFNLSELFKDERVTVEENLVHAYGYEKATEYLLRIRKVMAGFEEL